MRTVSEWGCFVGSSSDAETNTETNNLALDARTTNGTGTQIIDSIIVDPSDEVMIATIREHTAVFDVLMTNSTIQLIELLDLGKTVLSLADNQQIRMEEAGYLMLDQGVRMLELQRQQGKYVINFVEHATTLTFDLAGQVAGGSDERLEQALDLVAEVKTGGYASTLETVSTLMIIFGLGALYLTTRRPRR